MNFGFIESVIDDTHYVLGGLTKLPSIVLRPTGQWDKYLPKYEPQAERYETWGCTCWGWQNLIEILFKRLYDREPNYNERFTYLRAGVQPHIGADPHKVAECIRKDGLLNAEDLPFPDTYEAFRDPSDLTGSVIAKAQNWPVKYEFMHEWLWKKEVSKEDRTRLLKEALKYSPIAVSVTAWHKEGNVYVDNGKPNGHWCVLYGWNAYGWKVFDSYDHSEKILSYDHRIRWAKRAYITKARQKNWVIDLFFRLFT